MAMFSATGKGAAKPGQSADLAGRLGLAAAPTFAVMAWISVLGPQGMVMCSSASSLMPINDMAIMYLLMSVFHLTPWLRLISARSWRLDITTTQTEGD